MAKEQKAAKKAKDQARPAGRTQLTLADHPRAQHQIRTAKAWAGLLGFVAVALLSHRAGVPLPDALGRGVLGGVAANLVTWVTMVLVWRQIAVAELEVARRRLVAQLEAQAAEAASAERA
ncbi:MAG: hypothetical protein QOH43_1063 [Solirubrobacteraceae bacterium]|jgi:hypothetical protein|nr:hypothetical protein [Solirubrobacteraceae bacterium]